MLDHSNQSKKISSDATGIASATEKRLSSLCRNSRLSDFTFATLPDTLASPQVKCLVILCADPKLRRLMIPGHNGTTTQSVETEVIRAVKKTLTLTTTIIGALRDQSATKPEPTSFPNQVFIQADEALPLATPIVFEKIELAKYTSQGFSNNSASTLRIRFNPNHSYSFKSEPFKTDTLNRIEALIQSRIFSSKQLGTSQEAHPKEVTLDGSDQNALPSVGRSISLKDANIIDKVLGTLPNADEDRHNFSAQLRLLDRRLELLINIIRAKTRHLDGTNSTATGFSSPTKRQRLSLANITGKAGSQFFKIEHDADIATLHSYLDYLENRGALHQPHIDQQRILQQLTADHPINEILKQLNLKARQACKALGTTDLPAGTAAVYSLSFMLNRFQEEAISVSVVPADDSKTLPGASIRNIVVTFNEDALRGVLSATSYSDKALMELNKRLDAQAELLRAHLAPIEEAPALHLWSQIFNKFRSLSRLFSPSVASEDGFGEPYLRNLPKVCSDQQWLINRLLITEYLRPAMYIDSELPLSTPYVVRNRFIGPMRYTNLTFRPDFLEHLIDYYKNLREGSPEIYALINDINNPCLISRDPKDPRYDHITIPGPSGGRIEDSKTIRVHFLLWSAIQDALLKVGQDTNKSADNPRDGHQIPPEITELLAIIEATIDGELQLSSDSSDGERIDRFRTTRILQEPQLKKIIGLLNSIEVDRHDVTYLVTYFGKALRGISGIDLFTRVSRVFSESLAAGEIGRYNKGQEKLQKQGKLSDGIVESLELSFFFSPRDPEDPLSFRYLSIGAVSESSQSSEIQHRYRKIPIIITLPPSDLATVLAAKVAKDKALEAIFKRITEELKIYFRATHRDYQGG